MATSHQSPQSTLPPLAYKVLSTTTWGSGGNTCTITDPYIKTNSIVVVQVTGTTPPAGNWSYTNAAGSLTITSTDAESSTLPIQYAIY